MPKTLTLRNVPDAVVRALRRRARRNGRSMQAELLSIVGSAIVDKASMVEQLRACREGMENPMSVREIDSAIREGRP